MEKTFLLVVYLLYCFAHFINCRVSAVKKNMYIGLNIKFILQFKHILLKVVNDLHKMNATCILCYDISILCDWIEKEHRHNDCKYNSTLDYWNCLFSSICTLMSINELRRIITR